MRRLLLPALTCLALAGLATAAPAATLTLACYGKGQRNKDSSGTVLCASGAKGRSIVGTVKTHAGQPGAGKVTVTFSTGTPAAGGGFVVKKTGTKDISAGA